MSHDAIIEWAATLVVFGWMAGLCVLALLPYKRAASPKNEPERFPEPTDERAILGMMNAIEDYLDACQDQRARIRLSTELIFEITQATHRQEKEKP